MNFMNKQLIICILYLQLQIIRVQFLIFYAPILINIILIKLKSIQTILFLQDNKICQNLFKIYFKSIIEIQFTDFIFIISKSRILLMSQALKQKLKQRIEARKDAILKEKGIDVDLLSSVGPITPNNLPVILWQHPHILPEATRTKIIKGIQDFSTNIVIDILTGVAFNLLANKLYPAILKMPASKRLPLRFSLFTLPFGGTYPTLSEKFNEYHQSAEAIRKIVETGKKIKEARDSIK